MTNTPPVPDAVPLTDAQRLALGAAALRAVAPPELNVEAVRLRLTDATTPGARRFLRYSELAISRSFADATAERPEFETTIAHEVGHLIDPWLNLKVIPIAVVLGAFVVFVLSAFHALAIPAIIPAEGCVVLCIALFPVMMALSRAAEYRADLTAARLTSPDAAQAMLIAFPPTPQPQGWQRVLNTHPHLEQRQAHLRAALSHERRGA